VSLTIWVVIIIVSREFLITGLRLIAAIRGRVLPAERQGKRKTVLQILTILYCLVLVAIIDQFGCLLNPPTIASFNVVDLTLIFLTVGLTLWSGISYFAKNWDLVSEL
jgi:CDP-diacylglycerol--glycerol-3-phosphate 3-phosphatidyltransferase